MATCASATAAKISRYVDGQAGDTRHPPSLQGCAELQAARMGKASRSSSAPVMARVHSARAEVPQRTVLQAVVAQRGHAPEDVAAALCSAALQHSGDEQGTRSFQMCSTLHIVPHRLDGNAGVRCVDPAAAGAGRFVHPG